MKKEFLIIFTFLSILLFSLKLETAELEKTTAWKGTVNVSEKITLHPGVTLKILPGAKVIFHENGEIVCKNGALEAEGAEFESLYRSEKHFFSFESSAIKFKNCIFRNMYPGKVCSKYDSKESFFYAIFSNFTMSGCLLEKCSAIGLIWSSASSIEDNIFADIYKGAITFMICRNAAVRKNLFETEDESSELVFMNETNDSEIAQNRFCGKAVAMYIKGKSGFNKLIANSMFYPSTGIQIKGAGNNLIMGNLVFKPSFCGLRFISADSCNIVSNCIVWGAKDGGIGISIGNLKNLTVRNSVFSNCKSGLCTSSIENLNIINNVFWNNTHDSKNMLEKLKASKNFVQDPLFVDPENGNFRLQTKSFGYKEDSYLLKTGYPGGHSIGLFYYE